VEDIIYATGIDIETFDSRLDEAGIKYFECMYNMPANTPSVCLMDLDDYIELIKLFGMKVVFTCLRYYDEDDYKITDDLILEHNRTVPLEIIKYDVEEYNKKIDRIDFENPNSFVSFFVKDSIYYLYIEGREWIEDFDIDLAEEELNKILNNHMEEIDKIQDEEQEEINRLKQKLEQFILNDERFQVATNKNLRYTYVNNLVKSKEFKPYEKCFLTHNGYFSSIDVCSLVETLWRIYKSRK